MLYLGKTSELTAAAVLDPDRSTIVIVLVALIVFIGLGSVLIHRFIMQRQATDPQDSSMTRPVLAVLLVGSVIIFAAISFSFDDEQLRNLLVGGVISLSSAAVAFYFASGSATEARRDLLKATSDPVVVPSLTGQTLNEAQAIMSGSRLTLNAANQPSALPNDVVKSQDPSPGAIVKAGTAVTIRFGPEEGAHG